VASRTYSRAARPHAAFSSPVENVPAAGKFNQQLDCSRVEHVESVKDSPRLQRAAPHDQPLSKVRNCWVRSAFASRANARRIPYADRNGWQHSSAPGLLTNVPTNASRRHKLNNSGQGILSRSRPP
jgi:hypothetical protein